MSGFIHNDGSEFISDRLRRLQNREPILRKLAEMKVSRLKKNLTDGKDANGKAFATVYPWVRAASSTRGRSQKLTNIRPLLNTGQMRNSIAPVSITNDRAVISLIGEQLKKAERMVKGLAGRMAVSEKGIKGIYSGIKTSQSDGHTYCRINTPSGWRTKRVVNGKIAIKPRARPFMFFSSKDISDMARLVEREVKKAME